VTQLIPSTRLKQETSLRRPGLVNLTVYPDDDRYPERFAVSRQELLRFCWATLADLVPDEAAAAARESAIDLPAILTLSQTQPRKTPHVAAARPHAPRAYQTSRGSEAHKILLGFARLGGRGLTKDARAGAEMKRPDKAPALVSRLCAGGLMRRLDANGRGGPCHEGTFELTDAGWTELRRLSPDQQQEAA